MSLTGDKYETFDEASTRLNNSVVLYDGKPVYITDVRNVEAEDGKEVARVYIAPLPYTGDRPRAQRKFLSSRKFDLTPVPLGYMNDGGKCVLLQRAPVRQYKQGLCPTALLVYDTNGLANRKDWARLVRLQCFVDTIEGKYPSFQEAVEQLGKNGTTSVAISRNLCLVAEDDSGFIFLQDKFVKCGVLLEGEERVIISRKNAFLKEQLNLVGVPNSLG